MEYHCFVIGLGAAGIRAVNSMMDKSLDVAPDFLEVSYIDVDTEGDRLLEAKKEQRLNRFGCAVGR